MKPVAKPAALLIFASAIAVLPRSAPGQDDPACAKYQEPLAYNACLASHGPKANSIGEGPGQTQPPGAASHSLARPSAGSAPGREWPAATRRRGRVHMEFRVQ
jgi:hypothetical protein